MLVTALAIGHSDLVASAAALPLTM